LEYGRKIKAPSELRVVRSDIPEGLFEMFRWSRSYARAGGADHLVAVLKSIVLHNPEFFARRSLEDAEVVAIADAVLSRRDIELGFVPDDRDQVHIRMLATNIAALASAGSPTLGERDGFGRIPAFVDAEDLTQAIGISGSLFADLPEEADPPESPSPAF
jgi:hypothetical protein